MLDTPASQLLTQFGTALGMPDLTFDEAGQCHLLVDRHHLIQLVLHPRDLILMSCPLGLKAPGPQHFAAALQANFGQAAAGIVIAMAPDGKLCAQLGLRCTDTSCSDMLHNLETLLNEADRWNVHFAQISSPSSFPAPAPSFLAQTV